MGSGFSDVVMDHFIDPRHARPLPFPHGSGWVKRSENRFMRIQMCVQGDIIVEIGFGTYGCAPAIASGSYTCEWACGKSLQAAQKLTVPVLLDALGGLPPHRVDCAEMAVEALQVAISDVISNSARAQAHNG